MKIFKKVLLIVFLFLMIIASGLFGMSFYAYSEAKERLPIDEMYTAVKESVTTYTDYEDIDDDLIDAFVAVEDRRFFTRTGIDFIALGRAIFTNLISGSMQEGGSTITQQLIKNTYFSYDRNLIEKLAEYFFIYDVEEAYSKYEILEMYINTVNYGDGNFNVYDACHNYFGKDTDDLSVYEASLLAGIPNSPANYQLSNDNPNTYKRQTHVLEAMLEEGYITKSEYDEAIALQP